MRFYTRAGRDSGLDLRPGILAFLAILLVFLGCDQNSFLEPETRVLIVVVDGLRPEFVNPETMPNLNALAESGVRGMDHHAVFPTVTRVNGPSIFTGTYPGGHGLLGNSVYLPEVERERVLSSGDAADLRLIESRTGGHLLTAPTLGELLEDAGLTFFAASSGSSGSGMLMNHRGWGAGLVHHELCIPDTLAELAQALWGDVPEIDWGESKAPLVARAVSAVLEIGLDRADADVLAVWLTEPDGSTHAHGIGSPQALDVLAEVDAEIGRLVEGLESRGLLESTNVLITSDHGFSTQTGETSLTDLLVLEGLKRSADSRDVVVAGSAIHVLEGGEELIRAIVRLLQETDWIGPVFTTARFGNGERGSLPGTAPFSAVFWDHARAADILTSYNWSDAPNEFGHAGSVTTVGNAGHGTTSPYDIRATLVAAGPSFKRGIRSEVPTGVVDIVPTALALIGAPPSQHAHGRVLEELLDSGPAPANVDVARNPIVVSAQIGELRYELTVNRSRVGETVYVDGTSVTRGRGQYR